MAGGSVAVEQSYELTPDLREWLADLPRTDDFSEAWDACQAFSPIVLTGCLNWFRRNIVNDQKRPYDHSLYPHIGAPGGPCDAFDDPHVRTIALQWGSRLGKTFFGQAALIYQGANDPCPMMFGSSTETLCKDVLKRTYKMIRARADLNDLLIRGEHGQKQDHIELLGADIYGAWSGSASTLADKDIKVGHANEVSKWDDDKSDEGDPLTLFTDRFKNYQSVRKVIFESTPKVKGHCRIERLVKAGTNCRFYVPCYHCRRCQILEMGSPETPYGLKWESPANGARNKPLARKTAYYVCRYCSEQILGNHRLWMVRRGVWVPAGCEVIDEEALRHAENRLLPVGEQKNLPWQGWKRASWIRGTPVADTTDASYQLSSLYALALSLGDCAAEFVGSVDRPQALRGFVNGWLAETWETRRSKTTPELMVDRIGTPLEPKLCPVWARFLTVTIDRQEADGGFVKWTVLAHGPDDRAALVWHGKSLTLEECWTAVATADYAHADGGYPLRPVAIGVDSGFRTKETYEFCNAHDLCIAIKGANELGGLPYRSVELGDNVRSGASGQVLLHVNTDYWETDLQDRFDTKIADAPGCLNLNRGAANDWDLIDELLNGTLTDSVDRRGNETTLWVKKFEGRPNDFRDAARYGLCLARVWLDLHDRRMPERRIAPIEEVKPVIPPPPPAVHEDDSGGSRHIRRPGSGWLRR